MFGYMTFNMKYYILSQIFYKKFGWECTKEEQSGGTVDLLFIPFGSDFTSLLWL